MSTEKGIVDKLENDVAWVRARRKSACGTCANKSHCSSIDGGKHMLVKVNNALNAKKGDSVEFHLSSSFLLQCTFIIYIVPVLGLISGAIAAAPLAQLTGVSLSVATAVSTITGFLTAVWFSRSLIRKRTNNDRFLPNITRVY